MPDDVVCAGSAADPRRRGWLAFRSALGRNVRAARSHELPSRAEYVLDRMDGRRKGTPYLLVCGAILPFFKAFQVRFFFVCFLHLHLPFADRTYGFSSDTFKHPLLDGLPVPTALASIVERLHPNPFLWWVGQFMKYGLRLRPEIDARIERDKGTIEFTRAAENAAVVGFHVRRTDKVNEFPGSVHDLGKYFKAATRSLGSMAGKTVLVFVASDDHLVLRQAHSHAKHQAPAATWNVVSFPSNQTLQTQHARSADLYSIVRDVAVLAECDFVMCGFSSNVRANDKLNPLL